MAATPSTMTDGPRKSFIAGADLSAKQYFIMKLSANHTVDLASSPTTEILIGTLTNTPKAGDAAAVQHLGGGGTGLVKLGGTVSFGDMLTADSAGKAVATTTVGHKIIGMAVQDGVAGDIIEYVPVQHHRYAATS